MAVVPTERLAEVFVEIADTLVDDYDVIEFLQLVTNRTADLIGAADVGLLLANQRGLWGSITSVTSICGCSQAI